MFKGILSTIRNRSRRNKRLEIDDMPVSASDVRRAYEGSRMEDVKRWVPETTYQYLSECKK